MTTDSAQVEFDRIIAEILRRRASGETLSDADVIAAHPEHAEQLRVELKKLKIIENAQQRAEKPIDETLILGSSTNPNTSSDPVPSAGMLIRHYILVDQIGSGGFGTVWRALDSKLERDVAIKIPREGKTTSDEIERFIREARMSAHLSKHPNIVTVHEADWESETAFIVSDFIEGVSLGDRLELSPIPSDEAVDLAIPICKALHHAHESGIVHRDLKPDNILLDENNIPHVTDFGLAKTERHNIPSEVGQIMGTAAYMSPEQARGASEQTDRRSDVFSLGVVMFEMLTGERPFRGSVPRTLRQIIDQDPPKLRAFDSKIPLDLETICLKCLEKDPDLRYQTMEELQADLQRFQKHQPILARPIGTAGKLWRWCKRNPAIPWLTFALFLVTLGAMIAAAVSLDRQIGDMQSEIRTETERTSLTGNSQHASEEFKKILQDRIEDVLGMSRDEGIAQQLATWSRIDHSKRVEDTIPRFRKQVAEHADNPEGFPPVLREVHIALKNFATKWQQETTTSAQKIKSATEQDDSQRNESDPYSWFVNDSEGYQIARFPPKKTLGTDFWWRSYFSGESNDCGRDRAKPIDLLDEWRNPQLLGVHLSDIFLTDTGDAVVIAISAPVYDPDDSEKIIGIVGTFVEVGKLTELSENVDDRHNIRVVIYDGRKACGRSEHRAVPIQHGSLGSVLEELKEKQKGNDPELDDVELIEALTELTADLDVPPHADGDANFVPLNASYVDPLDPDETWLAMRNRDPIAGGLFVVTQMRKSAIEAPASHLRTGLIVLGLSVVGFSAAILIPMWIIILRLLIKE